MSTIMYGPRRRGGTLPPADLSGLPEQGNDLLEFLAMGIVRMTTIGPLTRVTFGTVHQGDDGQASASAVVNILLPTDSVPAIAGMLACEHHGPELRSVAGQC